MRRILNVAVSGGLLVILLPVMALVAIAVWCFLGRPVLFRQQRPGRDAKLFELLKFRSYKDLRDAQGNFLPNDQRDTRFGRFLRRTSLDELPQLWNVIKGDMNLVGPRPLIVDHLEQYTDHERRRLEVRPGITGWAQVNGRNSLSWERKFAYDVWYVDHRSAWLDFKILLITAKKVLWPDKIHHDVENQAQRETSLVRLPSHEQQGLQQANAQANTQATSQATAQATTRGRMRTERAA